VLTVGRLLLTIRDRLETLDNDVAANCEHHDCGFVTHRLDELHARLDGGRRQQAAGPQTAPPAAPTDGPAA
jgi:hypothetical protein